MNANWDSARDMRKACAVWIVCLLLAGGLIGLAAAGHDYESKEYSKGSLCPAKRNVDQPKLSYTPHVPIRINSNADFTAANGVTGGSGTKNDPWIIEKWGINGTGKGYALYIGNTTDYFVVRNSSFHHASGLNNPPYFFNSGVILYNMQNGTFENNKVFSNNLHGIFLEYGVQRNSIVGNDLFSNYMIGIYLYSACDHNNIMKNNASSNAWDGIILQYSSYNDVTCNILSSNGFGIELRAAWYANVTYNTIADNTEYGMNITNMAGGDRINHNNFINNHGGGKQARDEVGSNSWNETAEGNYWSDWTSPDSNGDGIVDNPYVLDGSAGAKDYYPLAKPVVTNGWFAGKVTNAQTGTAISGATVTAGSMSCITDSNGNYNFSVPARTYDLTASAINFKSKTETGKQVKVANTTTVDFSLTPTTGGGSEPENNSGGDSTILIVGIIAIVIIIVVVLLVVFLMIRKKKKGLEQLPLESQASSLPAGAERAPSEPPPQSPPSSQVP